MTKVHVYAQLLPFFLMLKFHILGDIFDVKLSLWNGQAFLQTLAKM